MSLTARPLVERGAGLGLVVAGDLTPRPRSPTTTAARCVDAELGA
ncbi:hypothetical protein ACWD1W_07725 [Streptomyces olivaceoviridis]